MWSEPVISTGGGGEPATADLTLPVPPSVHSSPAVTGLLEVFLLGEVGGIFSGPHPTSPFPLSQPP